jgi:alpha-beta hydrolase superfamily lysophospholipase
MTLELRYLPTAEGGTVAALDYAPRRPRGVALAVGHGYSSSKHNLDSLCAFLASHGFHVLSIDFPGHKLGASGGRLAGPDTLTDALDAAVRFARATYGPAVYTLGHSMGAATALRACAADPAITGAISIATGYGRPAILEAFAARGTVDLRSKPRCRCSRAGPCSTSPPSATGWSRERASSSCSRAPPSPRPLPPSRATIPMRVKTRGRPCSLG